MNPPRRVKVGPVDFTITTNAKAWKAATSRPDSSVDKDDYGVTYPWLGQISVTPDQVPAVQRLTVEHEVIHALLATACGSQDFRTFFKGSPSALAAEEKLVRLLEAPLLSLLRDNPRLVEYLMSKDV